MKKTKIKITQHVLKSANTHLETILLISDKELTRLSDWTVGYYHCRYCGEFKGFAYKLPSEGSTQVISAEAINERNAFWRSHCHGDGMILLLAKDIDEGDANG